MHRSEDEKGFMANMKDGSCYNPLAAFAVVAVVEPNKHQKTTYAATLVLLFLFFRPKVLSSTACGHTSREVVIKWRDV